MANIIPDYKKRTDLTDAQKETIAEINGVIAARESIGLKPTGKVLAACFYGREITREEMAAILLEGNVLNQLDSKDQLKDLTAFLNEAQKVQANLKAKEALENTANLNTLDQQAGKLQEQADVFKKHKKEEKVLLSWAQEAFSNWVTKPLSNWLKTEPLTKLAEWAKSYIPSLTTTKQNPANDRDSHVTKRESHGKGRESEIGRTTTTSLRDSQVGQQGNHQGTMDALNTRGSLISRVKEKSDKLRSGTEEFSASTQKLADQQPAPTFANVLRGVVGIKMKPAKAAHVNSHGSLDPTPGHGKHQNKKKSFFKKLTGRGKGK